MQLSYFELLNLYLNLQIGVFLFFVYNIYLHRKCFCSAFYYLCSYFSVTLTMYTLIKSTCTLPCFCTPCNKLSE